MGRLIQNGGVFDWTNTTEAKIKSGDPVVVGSIAGIAVRRIPAGETGAVSVEGIYELTTDGKAIALGAPVYIKDGTATGTATDATLIGYAVTAATASDTVVQVILK